MIFGYVVGGLRFLSQMLPVALFYQSSTTPVSVAAILHGSCNFTETRCGRDRCAAAGCAISATADVTLTVSFGLFFFFY